MMYKSWPQVKSMRMPLLLIYNCNTAFNAAVQDASLMAG